MASRNEHANRKGRESLSKRLGKVAKQIKARDNHSCVYCGATEQTSGSHLHLDHLTPKSRGGEDVAGNLALACRRCNCARKNMTLPQWAAYAGAAFGLVFTPEQILGQASKPLPSV